MHDSDKSVTGWFHAFRNGDEKAADQLWTMYFERICRIAGSSLKADPLYDADDFAVSVFDALFTAARDGRYETVGDRNELWGLMLVIARRKLIERHRRTTARKRSQPDGKSARRNHVEAVESREPAPDVSATVQDECRRLLRQLDDELLVGIALQKLDGNTVAEIASDFCIGKRTVERKLRLIRQIWQEDLDDRDNSVQCATN